MAQPQGFVDPQFPHHVSKLHKSIYGLKQAPRTWFDKFTGYLLSLGFSNLIQTLQCSSDITLVLKLLF